MESEKVYISGKLTGIPQEARQSLIGCARLRLEAEGYTVVEPTATEPNNEEQRKADILRLLGCNAIFMLSNWELSEKATLERDIAEGLKLSIEYETEPRNTDIKRAIKAVMGVPFKILAQDSRNRWHVYARMIYAHHCKKAGDNTSVIATETRHDESSIGYYLRHYESEYKYNREFHKAAEKIATLLSTKLQQAERHILKSEDIMATEETTTEQATQRTSDETSQPPTTANLEEGTQGETTMRHL